MHVCIALTTLYHTIGYWGCDQTYFMLINSPFYLYMYADPETFIEVGSLPKPDLYHHIVEDFLTDW